MANYYLDQEFIEGFRFVPHGDYKKPRHFIDLISIGIVSGDGRTFQAISKDYDYYDADTWVKNNVIEPLYEKTVPHDLRGKYGVDNFHYYYGQSTEAIAFKIKDFIAQDPTPPVFWGYYADYDWVLFCSLFGRMIDLPKGWPMYCRDLKQTLDEKAESLLKETQAIERRMLGGKNYVNLLEHEDALNYIKSLPEYPKQENEHDALADAKFNQALHQFLLTLK